jgi:hypothetical protein
LLTLREQEDDFALDMKRWTALKLYANKKLTIGQCAEFAEMNEEDFIKALYGKIHIPEAVRNEIHPAKRRPSLRERASLIQ